MAALSLVDPQTKADAAAVGEDECVIVHFNYKNKDLSITKIPTGNIYKQTLLSPFNLRKSYKIITMEKKLIINENETKDIYLLSRDDIRNYRSKYQFLHIGLVQFSMVDPYIYDVEPVFVRLRDSKHQNVQDSILVSFKTGVKNGAIKFNWFPNFSTNLSDLANSNALVVTIDPPKRNRRLVNNKYPSRLEPLLKVRYRVCYILMKKSLKPEYLFQNPVVEVNTEITNFVVPQI
jgi:hypothetical protein